MIVVHDHPLVVIPVYIYTHTQADWSVYCHLSLCIHVVTTEGTDLTLHYTFIDLFGAVQRLLM